MREDVEDMAADHRRHNDHPPRRIVLVEDQADAREMFRILLETLGHEVTEASDGEKAVQVIADVRPDIAFVDLGLPALDGFGVARQVREDASLNDVVLVALTGHSGQGITAQTRDAGFDRHLVKPASIETLRSVLAQPRDD